MGAIRVCSLVILRPFHLADLTHFRHTDPAPSAISAWPAVLRLWLRRHTRSLADRVTWRFSTQGSLASRLVFDMGSSVDRIWNK